MVLSIIFYWTKSMSNISTSMYLVLNKITYTKGFDKDGNETITPVKSTTKAKIGNGDNEISLSFISQIMQYLKNKNEPSSFKDHLSHEIYQGLSQKEKDIINAYAQTSDSEVSVEITDDIQVVVENNNDSVTDYKAKIGVPSDEYLNDMKLAEEYTFKIREDNKYRRKMERISGTTPLDELMVDMQGISTKPSNIHQTDWNRLNEYKINSPTFN